jgi:hypothetical protein
VATRKLSGGNQVPAQRLPYPMRQASLTFLCSESYGALTLAGHRAQIASLAPRPAAFEARSGPLLCRWDEALDRFHLQDGRRLVAIELGSEVSRSVEPRTSARQERRLRRALGQPVLHSMVRESRVLQLRICPAVPQPRTSSASSVIVSRGTGRGRGRWRRRCRVLWGL